MDLDKIHYFFTAAELKNFTHAAAQCHIAQTTMSKYIATLEKNLGVRLFERNGKTIFLTKAGEQFLAGIKPIVQQYKTLCESLKHQDRIDIGVVTTDYPRFQIIESFERAHPEISMFYTFQKPQLLLENLLDGQIDVILTPDLLDFYKPYIDRLSIFPIEETPVCLVCSQTLLSHHQTIENVIEKTPLITKAAEYRDHSHDELKKQFGSSFKETIIVEEYPKQLFLLGLGRGFAILPKGSFDNELVQIELSRNLFEHQILLIRKDGHSQALEQLLSYITYEKKCS